MGTRSCDVMPTVANVGGDGGDLGIGELPSKGGHGRCGELFAVATLCAPCNKTRRTVVGSRAATEFKLARLGMR